MFCLYDDEPRTLKFGSRVFVFEAHGSLLFWHGAHVDEPPPVTVWIDKAVRIHEAVILWLVVGRSTCGKRFGDKIIDLLTALATECVQNFSGFAGIADLLGREVAKPVVRQQHDQNRVADDDARARIVASLQVAGKAECIEEGN